MHVILHKIESEKALYLKLLHPILSKTFYRYDISFDFIFAESNLKCIVQQDLSLVLRTLICCLQRNYHFMGDGSMSECKKVENLRVAAIDEAVLLSVFFLSGVSALIYQVAWQRLLFGTFGVDVESITIVVSTFMLGLGCGALAGGQLADRFGGRVIELFALCEIGIGLFGALSPYLIPAVGERFMQYDLPVIALVNFVLILIPSTFMGATLPMLVSHLFRRSANVGVSIGSLYLANTLGAAIGAFATGTVLFVVLTLDQAIYLAAAGNFSAATIIFLRLRREVTA
jgi:predicted membrane-bound spermidine synthase